MDVDVVRRVVGAVPDQLDAFTADAWSKVMFILGPAAARELIKREKLTDFDVVWVDDKNQVVTTDGMASVLQMLKPPTPGN